MAKVFATLFLLVFVVVVAGVLWSVGASIGALFRRNEASHQVESDAGIWSARILWNQPGLPSGPVTKEVKRFTRRPSDSDSKPSSDNEKGGLGQWMDLIFGLDDMFIWLAAVLAVLALVASAVVMVLIALEIALLALIGAIVAALRSVRVHPWTIEVIDPLGAVSHVKVRSLKRARATLRDLQTQIAANELTTAQLSDS